MRETHDIEKEGAMRILWLPRQPSDLGYYKQLYDYDRRVSSFLFAMTVLLFA